jgi:hypothetical protein
MFVNPGGSADGLPLIVIVWWHGRISAGRQRGPAMWSPPAPPPFD